MPPGEAEPSANTRVLNTSRLLGLRSRTWLTQSSVFLSSGVIEALYSGLAMKMPLWACISALNLCAFSGWPSAASRSPL